MIIRAKFIIKLNWILILSFKICCYETIQRWGEHFCLRSRISSSFEKRWCYKLLSHSLKCRSLSRWGLRSEHSISHWMYQLDCIKSQIWFQYWYLKAVPDIEWSSDPLLTPTPKSYHYKHFCQMFLATKILPLKSWLCNFETQL